MNDSLATLLPGIFQQVFNQAALPGAQNKLTPLDALANQRSLPNTLKLPSGFNVPRVNSVADLHKMNPGSLYGMWNYEAKPAFDSAQIAKMMQSFGRR